MAERHTDLKRAFVPTGNGLDRQLSGSEADMRKLGWTYRVRRSRKTGRTVVFVRVKPSAT